MNAIQGRILEIFLEIKKICDRNNIMYFAIGGTCIGAVRHKGFIPWDDDLDIAIPIEKFDKFKKIAERELPPYLKIYSCNDVVHYFNIFIKVIDTRTAFIEEQEYQYPDAYKGVFVDVMPMSGIPKLGLKREIFYTKRKLFSSLNGCIRFPEHKWKSQILNSICNIIKDRKSLLTYRYFSDKWMVLLQKYPFSEAEFVGYVWSNSVKRLTFPKRFFENTVELTFESTTIRCPQYWDEYLRMQFGNYMELPPLEQQKAVHPGIIELEHSYFDFQKSPSRLLNLNTKEKG